MFAGTNQAGDALVRSQVPSRGWAEANLPGVVLTAGAGTVVVGAIRVLAVVTGEGLALVEARLLHEETLARLPTNKE